VGRRLGGALGERVADRLMELGLDATGVLVVPVPTTRRRRFGNGGLDHALVLARGVAGRLGGSPTRLLRRKHRPRQVASSAAERARNVKGAFSMRSGLGPPACDAVVLVDDVRTTGATASACFREIAGAYSGPGAHRGGAVPRKTGRIGNGYACPLPVLILATGGVSESRRSKTALTEREGG
jgi:hypothetical protein